MPDGARGRSTVHVVRVESRRTPGRHERAVRHPPADRSAVVAADEHQLDTGADPWNVEREEGAGLGCHREIRFRDGRQIGELPVLVARGRKVEQEEPVEASHRRSSNRMGSSPSARESNSVL
jgi:hypothetical protein